MISPRHGCSAGSIQGSALAQWNYCGVWGVAEMTIRIYYPAFAGMMLIMIRLQSC
jgi:hypothetical protein